jgi:hypothetical protein
MCWRPLTPPLRGAAVYLVRSFRTNARIRSLTTGTFNRVVKDRIAFRLSGAPSVLDGLTTSVNPAVLETLQTYVAAQTLSTRASHRISTRFPHWRTLGTPHRKARLSTGIKKLCPSEWPKAHEEPAFRNRRGTRQRATVWPSALDLQSMPMTRHMAFRP